MTKSIMRAAPIAASVAFALVTTAACKPTPQVMNSEESERFFDNMAAVQNASHDAAVATTRAMEKTDADAAQNRVDRAGKAN